MAVRSEDSSRTRLELRRSRAGDEEARNALLARYYPVVRRIVCARLGPGALRWSDSDDLLQETMVSIVRSMDDVTYVSNAEFVAWLARVVEHRIHDGVRWERRLKRGSGAVGVVEDLAAAVASRDASPSSIARFHEFEQIRVDAMARLSERHREVLLLRDECELPFDAIARELQLPSSAAARGLLARARAKLATEMRPQVGHQTDAGR